MPNYCSNDLVVSGKAADVKAALAAIKATDGESPIDFQRVAPPPETRGDEPHLWFRFNWGTTSNALDADCRLEERGGNRARAKLHFRTSWTPPLPVIDKLGELFPKVTWRLRYYERGVGFKGRYRVRGDRVLTYVEEEYRGQRGG